MKKLGLFMMAFVVWNIQAQNPVFTTAKTESATVYFSGAELSQKASVQLPSGSTEVVISNIANALNENTIRVGAPTSVTVLSVQYTHSYEDHAKPIPDSPQIKRIKDSVQWTQTKIQKLANERISLFKTIEILDKNHQLIGNQNGVNTLEVSKWVEFYSNKRINLSHTITDIQENEKVWQERLQQLNTRLHQVQNKSTVSAENSSKGKIILQVMNQTAGPVNFQLSYVTPQASWVPFYDLRAVNVNIPMDLQYKAQVQQNTGVDWKQVKLSLSSGIPNQNNQAPLLRAWFLRLAQPIAPVVGYMNQDLVTNKLKGSVRGLAMEEVQESSMHDFTTLNEGQLNISFDIDMPYDILSNGKKHSVALKSIKLPATYKYYAVPKLDREAFLLAEISDYAKYHLLRGEANIIFDGLYVGKTILDPNQTTDTLFLSMGKDKKISINREKISEKSGTKFLSSYKEQTFTFDITVRNNKKETVKMTLKDQYPLSTDQEITVELLQSDKALVNKETGILTWDLELGPNETKKVRISYKVKYPKDKTIPNL